MTETKNKILSLLLASSTTIAINLSMNSTDFYPYQSMKFNIYKLSNSTEYNASTEKIEMIVYRKNRVTKNDMINLFGENRGLTDKEAGVYRELLKVGAKKTGFRLF